ncbi:MAG: hypothetical protein QXI16_06445, partial [Sulfolobaceae archaeon]
EEWKWELLSRAENFLLSQGMIPPDHFDTMRHHPAFKTEILPVIMEITEMMHKRMPAPAILEVLDKKRQNDYIKILLKADVKEIKNINKKGEEK